MVASIEYYHLIDDTMLRGILNRLPEIFSEVHLLIRDKDFITIPESYFHENLESLFALSYVCDAEDEIRLDKTEHKIGVAYAVNKAHCRLIEEHYPRVKVRHETTVVLGQLYSEVNLKESRILISINHGRLNIYILNQGKLLLCNSFVVKSNDDIFYFVMLCIEQLHLVASQTEMVILGEPPSRDEIFDLFKNYIQEINIWIEDYHIEEDIKNFELMQSSFPLQLLVCA